MNLERIHNMLNTKEKVDVYYNERPVWVQEIHDNIARISFIDNFEEKDVYIEDLYENDLYNQKTETIKQLTKSRNEKAN